MDAPHHLSSDHADLIDDDQLRSAKVFLEVVELVSVGHFGEVRGRKPANESVHRGRVEAEIESGCPRRCSDFHESIRLDVGGEIRSLQSTLQLL